MIHFSFQQIQGADHFSVEHYVFLGILEAAVEHPAQKNNNL